jgi:hypothetical protein
LTLARRGHTVESVSDPTAASSFSYRDRVLAYIDILGWKDIIRRSAKKDADDSSGLADVATALRALRTVEDRARAISEHVKEQGAQQLKLEVTLFSDTAVLSCEPNMGAINILVSQVQAFCVDLMLEGIFTRGAIVRGRLHHQDGVIVGPALVEAYELESTAAKFPRIVLADNVQPLILGLSSGQVIAERVEQDRDMLLILNPFVTFQSAMSPAERRDRMVMVQQRAVRTQQDHYADLGIRAKMGWLITFITRQLERPEK